MKEKRKKEDSLINKDVSLKWKEILMKLVSMAVFD